VGTITGTSSHARRWLPLFSSSGLNSDDPEALRAAAAALAKVGDAASINVLMDAVLSKSNSLADVENSSDARISAAWSALRSLYNPEVVPTLQSRLESGASSLEVSMAASLLAGWGTVETPEARQALLSWAKGAGDELAPIARHAFAKFWHLRQPAVH